MSVESVDVNHLMNTRVPDSHNRLLSVTSLRKPLNPRVGSDWNGVMRARGSTFREMRCVIGPEFQRKIIECCKHRNKLTWAEFAKQLGVSEFTLRCTWRHGKSTLPYSIVEAISQLLPVSIKNQLKDAILEVKNPFWGQQLGGLKSALRAGQKISLPNTDSVAFAEFYGILLGDGCVFSNLKSFCITSDSLLDASYIISYVAPLISKLFGKSPSIYRSKSDRSMRCVLHSVQASRFLVEFGFPRGEKSLGKTFIPPKFFENSDLLKACTRGLVDTDGSLCPHPNTKIMVDLTVKIPALWRDCRKAFACLRLNPSLSQSEIYLYGFEKVKKYFEKVGSSNVKHIWKYTTFKESGKVPTTAQARETMSNGKYKLDHALPFTGPVV